VSAGQALDRVDPGARDAHLFWPLLWIDLVQHGGVAASPLPKRMMR
jgi:hypothetical protein